MEHGRPRLRQDKYPLLPYDFAREHREFLPIEQNQASFTVVAEKKISARTMYQELARGFCDLIFTVRSLRAQQEFRSTVDSRSITHAEGAESEFKLPTSRKTLTSSLSQIRSLPTEDLLSGANDAPIIKLINGVIEPSHQSLEHQTYTLSHTRIILL